MTWGMIAVMILNIYFVVAVAQCCLTLGDTMTIFQQVPLSMELSRHEYWNGLPFPTPGDLPGTCTCIQREKEDQVGFIMK